MRVSVREDTPLIKTKENFQKFFKNEVLAEVLFQNCTKANTVCTKGINALYSTSLPTEQVSPCKHEEADTRLLVHVNDIVHSGLKRDTTVCTDTDVFVIALNVFYGMSITELWIEFRSAKNCRWLLIHTIAEQLGEKTCRNYHSGIHLLVVIQYLLLLGKEKKTAWETWNSFPETTSCFMRDY